MKLIDCEKLIEKLRNLETFPKNDWHKGYNECLHNSIALLEDAEPVDAIPVEFIEKITHRDICLVYRGCLLMLLEKWREENESNNKGQ